MKALKTVGTGNKKVYFELLRIVACALVIFNAFILLTSPTKRTSYNPNFRGKINLPNLDCFMFILKCHILLNS